MLSKNSYAQRFGYLKLDSIDMKRWKSTYMKDSKYTILWVISYVLSNHLAAILLFAYFLLDLGVIAFFLPSFGLGDRLFPMVMLFEHGIPISLVRWVFISFSSALLLLKFAANFVHKGIQLQRDITLGEVMRNRYARRLICLRSYSKWRLFDYLIRQCSMKEYIISWTLYCNDEWKRFMVFKSAIFLIACLQLHEMTIGNYVPPDPLIHDCLFAYWAFKVLIFIIELLSKLTAFLIYLFYIRRIDEIQNGCSLTDYWQNRVIERASPFISLKNPFLEPPPGEDPIRYSTNHQQQQNASNNLRTQRQSSIGYKLDDINIGANNNNYETVRVGNHPFHLTDHHYDLDGNNNKNTVSTGDYFKYDNNERPISEADTEITGWFRGRNNRSQYNGSEYRPNMWSRTASYFTDYNNHD